MVIQRRSDKPGGKSPRGSHGFSSSVSFSRAYSTSILYGPTGAQKSSTVFLHWPEPIYTLNFDGGRDIPAFLRAKSTCSICGIMRDEHEEDEGLAAKDGNARHPFRGTTIHRADLSSFIDFDELGKDSAIREGKKQLAEFYRDYHHALEEASASRRPGTICIDTFGELKPRICASIIGSSEIPFKQLKAQGRLNQICRDIVNKARVAKVHLVIIARESEIYVNRLVDGKTISKATGYFKPKVPPALLQEVDWAGYIDLKVETRRKETTVIPSITMFKCGGNTSELRAKYTPEDWGEDGPFAWVCYNQWLDSELKDWKRR